MLLFNKCKLEKQSYIGTFLFQIFWIRTSVVKYILGEVGISGRTDYFAGLDACKIFNEFCNISFKCH